MKDAPLIPSAPLEAQDEGDEIERERQDPQERHRGDIVRDVIGHGEQHERAHGGEQQPPHVIAWRGRRARIRYRNCFVGLDCAPPPDAVGGGSRTQRDKRNVRRAPAPRLGRSRDPRLECERIRDQRKQRAEIGQREQAIYRARGKGAREPRLHQRPGSGEQEIGQSDGDSEQSQDAPRRVLVAGGLPVRARDDGQRGEARGEEHDVQHDLPARGELARGPVRIGVACEQQGLEEHEAGSPHRGRAAEPRQDLLGDDRLDQEQQERAREDREGVESHAAGDCEKRVLYRRLNETTDEHR